MVSRRPRVSWLISPAYVLQRTRGQLIWLTQRLAAVCTARALRLGINRQVADFLAVSSRPAKHREHRLIYSHVFLCLSGVFCVLLF